MRCAIILLSAIAAARGDDDEPRAVGGGRSDALLTVAERSDFRATARYEEVVTLLDSLAAASPLVRRTELGKTGEGRSIPVILISDPPVGTSQDAARQVAENDKLLVFAIGNIHAGEVDGKEALPMVARELITTPHHPLLRDLILAFAPIYNADGNERVSKTNRPGQVGPDEGMGQRENAAGLDLNRDFVKLAASETRGLVDFLNRWDPAIFIDTHTTNGCYHRYIITYEGPKVPAGDAGIIRFVRDTMLPDISARMEPRYGVPSFYYGDFNAAHDRWETYPATARYGTSYVGVRGRISVLSEGYSYAPYEQRVLGTRDFVTSILEFAAANKSRIKKLLADADAAAIAAGASAKPDDRIALRARPVAAPRKFTARGFVEEQRGGRTVPTPEPRDYPVELWNQYEPALTVARPYAYVIPPEPPALSEVIEKLRQHGVRLERLAAAVELPIEVYRIERVDFAAEPFQNHRLVRVDATPQIETRTLPAGSILVRTGQRLGALAVYLLEPQCEDGLTAWNFLDAHLAVGADFPILRIPQAPPDPLATVRHD